MREQWRRSHFPLETPGVASWLHADDLLEVRRHESQSYGRASVGTWGSALIPMDIGELLLVCSAVPSQLLGISSGPKIIPATNPVRGIEPAKVYLLRMRVRPPSGPWLL